MIAIISTLAFVGRILCQPLPNIQPVTAILILVTFYLGTVNGLYVAILSIGISNIFLGIGPWTLYQIASFLMIILLTGFFVKPFYRVNSMKNRVMMALFAGFSGLLYGFVISIFYVITFRMSSFWAYYIQGLPFDFLHALGNITFYLILEPLLAPMFQKINIK